MKGNLTNYYIVLCDNIIFHSRLELFNFLVVSFLHDMFKIKVHDIKIVADKYRQYAM